MIRLLVADDHEVIREGIRSTVGLQPDMKIVAETDNGGQVVALLREHQIDVLVLDIVMPGPGFVSIMETVKKSTEAARAML